MRLARIIAIAGVALCAPPPAENQEAARCDSCERDSRGRIKRSPRVHAEFRRLHPCPSTGRTDGPCPTHRADHHIALRCAEYLPVGVADLDVVSNLRWQTVADAKRKDRVEGEKAVCIAMFRDPSWDWRKYRKPSAARRAWRGMVRK